MALVVVGVVVMVLDGGDGSIWICLHWKIDQLNKTIAVFSGCSGSRSFSSCKVVLVGGSIYIWLNWKMTSLIKLAVVVVY